MTSPWSPAQQAALDQEWAAYGEIVDNWVKLAKRQAKEDGIDRAIGNASMAVSRFDKNTITGFLLVFLKRELQKEEE